MIVSIQFHQIKIFFIKYHFYCRKLNLRLCIANVRNKNERIAIPVVLFAGLLWSFGPLVVRYMDQPNLNPWQYLFTRGVVIFILLNVYLFFLEGKEFL